MRSKSIPIGSTIKYGSFVLTKEYDDLLARFTAMQMEINGCKKRTARGEIFKTHCVAPHHYHVPGGQCHHLSAHKDPFPAGYKFLEKKVVMVK